MEKVMILLFLELWSHNRDMHDWKDAYYSH